MSNAMLPIPSRGGAGAGTRARVRLADKVLCRAGGRSGTGARAWEDGSPTRWEPSQIAHSKYRMFPSRFQAFFPKNGNYHHIRYVSENIFLLF